MASPLRYHCARSKGTKPENFAYVYSDCDAVRCWAFELRVQSSNIVKRPGCDLKAVPIALRASPLQPQADQARIWIWVLPLFFGVFRQSLAWDWHTGDWEDGADELTASSWQLVLWQEDGQERPFTAGNWTYEWKSKDRTSRISEPSDANDGRSTLTNGDKWYRHLWIEDL